MRRSGIALLSAGTVALLSVPLVGGSSAAAAPVPGSGLGRFNLSASAPAVQFRFEEPNYCKEAKLSATGGCEGVLPEAVATLRNGPIGYALSSVVWPGTLAGNFGSLLIVAGNGSVPDSATALNDPVKAEARNSTGDPSVTYEPAPGTRMMATALDDRSIAEGSIGQSQAPVGTFGNTFGKATTQLTGPKTAIATAHSEAKDIDLGGVVKIGSVISDASATTDGTTASARGTTTMSDMTIGGVPVTLDGRGLTVQGTTLGAPAATAAVNAALANAGMSIAMSPPSGKPDGGSITYNAGSVVFLWKPQPGTTMTAVLGGANVSVASAEALNFSVPEFVVPPFVAPPVVPPPVTQPIDGGTAGTPPLDTLTGTTPELPGAAVPEAANPLPQVLAPLLAGSRLPLPGGLSPWAVLLGLGGAGLVCAGLRRLPDRVLEHTGPICLLEERA